MPRATRPPPTRSSARRRERARPRSEAGEPSAGTPEARPPRFSTHRGGRAHAGTEIRPPPVFSWAPPRPAGARVVPAEVPPFGGVWRSGRGEPRAGLAHDFDERGQVGLRRRVVEHAGPQREVPAERGLGEERAARGLDV